MKAELMSFDCSWALWKVEIDERGGVAEPRERVIPADRIRFDSAWYSESQETKTAAEATETGQQRGTVETSNGKSCRNAVATMNTLPVIGVSATDALRDPLTPHALNMTTVSPLNPGYRPIFVSVSRA
jgi:hypothetical protein